MYAGMTTGAPRVKLATSILEELWFGEDDPHASDAAAANSLAAKLAELEGLRPFPLVVQRVMDYVRRPDFDARKLQLMIEEDPALSAKVLRIANSAAFAGVQQISSIRDAALRLGARTVSDMAASIAAMAFFKDVAGAGRAVRDHTVATAMVVRVLSTRTEWASPTAYITGLLHDMGKLLLLQTKDVAYAALLADVKHPDECHLRERELVGFDHAILAGHALKTWGLPDPIPKIIAWHHQPVRAYALGGDVGMAVALLRIADQLEPQLRTPKQPAMVQLERFCANSDCSYAGMEPRDLAKLWPDLQAAHAEAAKLFR